MPKISVIIPVYNVELYLARCLDSIINQTLKDIEIICVNDCSPDNSLAILEDYAKKDNRIKIIDNKNNKGAGATRNIGIRTAVGKYLGFVDSDDWIDLDYYEKLYIKAQNTGADIVKANLKYHKDDILSEGHSNIDEVKISKYKFIYIPTAIFSHAFIRNNNIYYPEDLSCAEDSIFEIKTAIFANKIAIEESAFYYYLYRDESVNHCKVVSLDKIKEVEKSAKMVIEIINSANLSKDEYILAIENRYDYLNTFCKNKDVSTEVLEYVKNANKKIFLSLLHAEDVKKMDFNKRAKNMWNKKRESLKARVKKNA